MKYVRLFLSLLACMFCLCACNNQNNADLQKQIEELQKQNEELSNRLETPVPTATPVPTSTPTLTNAPMPTATSTPTQEPTVTPTNTPIPTDTPTPTPRFTFKEMDAQMYAKSSVNVRDLPSTEGEKIGSLTAWEKVKVTGQCKETSWYRIEFNGQTGYVSNNYLTENKPTPTPTNTPKPTINDVELYFDKTTIKLDSKDDIQTVYLYFDFNGYDNEVEFEIDITGTGNADVVTGEWQNESSGVYKILFEFSGLENGTIYVTYIVKGTDIRATLEIIVDLPVPTATNIPTPTPTPETNISLSVQTELPKSFDYYATSGNRLYGSADITDVKYEFKQDYNGLYDLTFNLSGEITYFDDAMDYFVMSYTLYDSEGYVVDTDNIQRRTSASGEKFRNMEKKIYDLPAGAYTLVLHNNNSSAEAYNDSDAKTDQGDTNQSKGYGQVKGQITWQYNDFVGTRGDNGAIVMLIPENDDVKNYDNSLAAMLHSGEYDSGIIVKKCDGYGNFDFGDRIPAGRYRIIVISENTTSSSRFNDEDSWEQAVALRYGKYFSDADLEIFKLFLGFSKIATDIIEVEDNRVNTITHDFGNTYI